MIAKSALRSGYAKRMLNGVFGRFLAKWWRARELRRGELRQWFRKAAAWALKDVVREHKQKQMERRGIENIKVVMRFEGDGGGGGQTRKGALKSVLCA